jgi:opacity protein-like surface antigen
MQGAFTEMETGGTNPGGPFVNFGNDRDDVLSLGGALGLSQDHGRFRTRGEIEGMWYDDQENLFTGRGGGGGPVLFYDTHIDNNWSVMGNFWADLYAGEYLAWYLGGGLGAAGANLSTEALGFSADETDRDFAWQFGTGLLVNISDNAEIDFGYRYVDLGELESDLTFAGLPAGTFNVDRVSHNVGVTLRYYLYE